MIETERLRLIPLRPAQLRKYILADNSLEEELQLNSSLRTISPALKEALEETILPNASDPNRNYLFSTLWTMVLKSENKMVGDLCFVGEPDENGAVEIGYGTYEEFRKMGLMSEAVAGIIGWARLQPQVKSIRASTEKSNADSYRVLQHNQFDSCGETETLLHWRLDLTS